jgi:hypothetical protein
MLLPRIHCVTFNDVLKVRDNLIQHKSPETEQFTATIHKYFSKTVLTHTLTLYFTCSIECYGNGQQC